jgi:Diguanylate cyclase, GGDEF domain
VPTIGNAHFAIDLQSRDLDCRISTRELLRVAGVTGQSGLDDSGGLCAVSARELCHARDRELISRWPTLALVVTHAGFLLARIPFASVVASSAAAGQPHSAVVLVMAAEALFVNFCLPFLRVAMSKERAELEQRRVALTDSLTGVANRRAFFDLGERLLARTIADRRPAALLLFDLDRFKEVNASEREVPYFARLA